VGVCSYIGGASGSPGGCWVELPGSAVQHDWQYLTSVCCSEPSRSRGCREDAEAHSVWRDEFCFLTPRRQGRETHYHQASYISRTSAHTLSIFASSAHTVPNSSLHLSSGHIPFIPYVSPSKARLFSLCRLPLSLCDLICIHNTTVPPPSPFSVSGFQTYQPNGFLDLLPCFPPFLPPFFLVLRMEPRAWCTLSKCSITELHPQSLTVFYLKQSLTM
jgi:hypothetical protein